MMLLPLLALAMQTDDPAYECEIKRRDRALGAYTVSGVFPPQTAGPDFTAQSWSFKRGRLLAWLNWFSPDAGAPKDSEKLGLMIDNVPKGVNEVRVELWRDGQRISEQVGDWTDLQGQGYRQLMYWMPLGTLRALAQPAPISVVVVDHDGELVTKATLPLAVIEAPITFANSTQGSFAELAANPAKRCPYYNPGDIVVT